MADWIAAATSYANSSQQMIPFYIYYSMFGFQRIGDLAWAAGDMRARGFLLGGTAGRTTLNGEGLQHEDGHSHIQAGLIPNCISYDPTFAYELAVIVQDGLRRMYAEQEDVFYYLTLMNENYVHSGDAGGRGRGHPEGHVPAAGRRRRQGESAADGSGTILREVMAAADLLKNDFGVAADIWSVTSFNQLRRDGMEASATICCTRPPRRAPATSNSSWPAVRARWWPLPTTSATTPTRSANTFRAVTWCWAPTAAPTAAPTCASFFEVDRYHVALVVCPRWRATARSKRPRWPRRSPSTASRPTSCLAGSVSQSEAPVQAGSSAFAWQANL